ncbi:hypothetical protein [Nocardiopsis chromatogenes]|uniref:hypothetical protein n=1 Tax=Nocardiopsis chromatogenes TaxID=280239 RepID=UPI000370EEF3|nr:hypothetical protein [Nocardiopsis chromatogenes]
MTTRMTAGFAVFAFAALGAGPALADDAPEAQSGAGAGPEAPEAPQTLDAPVDDVLTDVEYTCTSEFGDSSTETLSWFFETSAVDGEAATGDTLMHAGGFDGGIFWFAEGAGPVTSMTVTGRVTTTGEAAVGPEEHLETTWSGSSKNPFEETEGWNYDGLAGERELTRPGSITYRPSGVTFTAVQEDGTTTTTTCDPESTPVLTEVTVTGDPIGGGDDGDDENPGGDDGGDGGENPGGDDGDGGDDQNPGGDDGGDGGENPGGDDGDKGGDKDGSDGGDKGEDKPAPGGDSADGDNGGALPVTGAALGGLVAAAVAAVGGGGAAMYFSRKKKNAAAENDA